MTTEQRPDGIDRLPQRFQRYIQTLERSVEAAEARFAEQPKTRVRRGGMIDDAIYLPDTGCWTPV